MISRIEEMVIAMRKHEFPHSNSVKQWKCLATRIMLQPVGAWKIMTRLFVPQQTGKQTHMELTFMYCNGCSIKRIVKFKVVAVSWLCFKTKGGHPQGNCSTNFISFGRHLSISRFKIMSNIPTFCEYIRDISKGCSDDQFKRIIIPSLMDTTDWIINLYKL